jgi:hypothetical protein
MMGNEPISQGSEPGQIVERMDGAGYGRQPSSTARRRHSFLGGISPLAFETKVALWDR